MKYVALLRGINVGGNNKIDMATLRQAIEGLGYTDVSTYVNSGNVVFASRQKDQEKIATTIEKKIHEVLMLDIRVVVRDQDTIKNICEHVPGEWVNDKDQKTDVMFLWSEYDDPDVLDMIATNPDVDTVEYVDGVIVWHLEKKNYPQSKMHDLIKNKVYKNMTVRNINTVRKIYQIMTQ